MNKKMKPFDYQKYLKNNPLLKEGHEAEIGFGPAHQKPDIEEAGGFTVEKAPSPTAVAVTRFWRSTFLPFVEKRVYDIDIEAIEDALDSVAGKRISTGQLPEFGKLNTAQLQKVILFLMQVIKRKKFDMFDTWDKKTNTIVRDTDEDDDYFEESEDPSQEKVTEGNRPWDFNVYDMDAMQMAQFKKAAERLGFKARLDEVGIGMVEIRLWPSNDITFKQAFKILEKMGLEFDESHGMFSSLEEAKLDPVNQQLKDKYLQDYLTQTLDDHASEYDDDLADFDTIEAHAKKFGYEDTLRTIDAKNDPKFSKRGIPHGGFDPLQGKVVGNYDRSQSSYRREPVITKKGKMHKYDTNFIKNKIKSDLGLDY